MTKTFKLTKNDKVYVAYDDPRRQGHYVTVKSVGTKYITVDGMSQGENRFNINTFLSADSPWGYNIGAQLFPDEASYLAALEDRELARRLYSGICDRLKKANTATLKVISATLFKLNL